MDNELLSEMLFSNIKNDTNYYEEKYPERRLDKNQMVTRFAPSPTGFVHMGSLYVAFINRLLANQNGGVFYLRIEDTDQKREVTDGVKKIKEALDYFNITVDESPFNEGVYGPYTQSKRKEIYQTYVKDLVKKGLAYPCFCTPEELEGIREQQVASKVMPGYYGEWAACRNMTLEEVKRKIDNNEQYVIRLKTPTVVDEKIECSDMIKGKIYFPTNDIDIVLLKSDGLPTYHLAHAIDDHLMHTTHVVRGDEWLSSLPVHLQLFYLLGFKAPKYAHISPLTKKEENSIRKLSKRKDPESAISFYQELGIPVEGLKLYFATIANSNFEQWYTQNKGLSISDFTFAFNKMSEGGTLFDIEKLTNICKIYFSLKNCNDLYNEALAYYKEYDTDYYGLLLNNKEYALDIFNIERDVPKPRKDISCYQDIKKETWYMFDELFYDNVSYKELIENNTYNSDIFDEYLNNYFSIDDNEEQWYNRIKALALKLGYAPDMKSYKLEPDNYKGHVGDICETLRVALTGKTQTPSLYQIQKVLGVDRMAKRINNFKNEL